MTRTGTYKGFKYVCKTRESEQKLVAYIDWLGDTDELRDVSQENYFAWRADYDFDGVSFLSLPLSIKRIGKCVFAQSKIEELVADGVEQIDELAFYNTKDLKRVCAKNCKYLLSTSEGEFTDGSDAFNHSSVERLELPSVERVGRYAFYDMANLRQLELPSLIDMEPYAVYGTKIERLDLGNLQRAKTATVRHNEALKEIRATHLKEMWPNAFEEQYLSRASRKMVANKCQILVPNGVKVSLEKNQEPLAFNAEIARQSEKRENFNYDFDYNGFKFNFAEGVDQELAFEGMKEFIDKGLVLYQQFRRLSYKLPASENMDKDESAPDVLKTLKDIYVPEYVKDIGDYAFAKCYGLESFVAPGVRTVGDHAFYCDSVLRYVDLPSCELLAHDSFNGASYDYADGKGEKMAKFFAENVEFANEHTFWQTGFRVIDMPRLNLSAANGVVFDENPVLQKVVVKGHEKENFLSNPQLVCLVSQSPVSGICGSPLLEECGKKCE